jgi:competence ComEA-like helix-hairpin-helix protein
MDDVETRALARAAGVLLVLSVVRLGWNRARPPLQTGGAGGDVLPGLLQASRADLTDASERGRALRPGERIDPNRASAAQLDRLPGVGPSLAGAIVQERKRHGPFQRLGDLERVPGLGSGMLARIRPRLDLDHPPAGGGSRPRSGPTPLVDVNRADTTALQALPGVGPALARRIVESRRKGPFHNLQDLARVKGIGPTSLRRLRGRVRFEPRP